MVSRGDGSSLMEERPSQEKVVTSIDIQYLKLRAELCGSHLNGEIHCSVRVSLNPIKFSHVDLVLLQFPKVIP